MSKTTRSSLSPTHPLNINAQSPLIKKQKGIGSQTQRAKSVTRNIFKKYPHISKTTNFVLGRSTFGEDAPHFTIPSSRRDSASFQEQSQFPGPGAYDIFNNTKPISSRIAPTAQFRSASLDKGIASAFNNDETLTSNIDFIDNRQFPQSKPVYIGVRTKHDFYDIIDSPGPSYVPPLPDTRIHHRILSSGRDYNSESAKANTDPIGPGAYNVKYTLLTKREPSYNIGDSSSRGNWMTASESSVGPGSYNPVVTTKKEPQWSIGKKSRPSGNSRYEFIDYDEKIKRKASKNVPKDLIAVDQLIIHLEILKDPKGARSYIVNHPQLRNIVHQILELVLAEKPDNPVAFIENYFKDIDDKEYRGMYQASKQDIPKAAKAEVGIEFSDSYSENEEHNE